MSSLHEQTNVALMSYQILLGDRGVGDKIARGSMEARDLIAKAWELSDIFIEEREKREVAIKEREDAEFQAKVKEAIESETDVEA